MRSASGGAASGVHAAMKSAARAKRLMISLCKLAPLCHLSILICKKDDCQNTNLIRSWLLRIVGFRGSCEIESGLRSQLFRRFAVDRSFGDFETQFS
jgi:hypothetical protein